MLSNNLSAIPRFAEHWLTAIVDEATLLVQSEHQRALLQGKALVRVVKAIDGRRNVAQLAEHLQADMSPLELAYVLDRLEQSGYLQSGHTAADSDIANPLAHPIERSAFSIKLQSTGPDLAFLRQQIDAAGLTTAEPADLTVLICEDYLQAELSPLIESTNGPLLLAKVSGQQILIGPLFDTSVGPCWHCLQHALRRNRPVQQWMQRLGIHRTPPLNTNPASLVAASGLLSMTLAQIAAGDLSLRQQLLSVNLEPLNVERHPLRQRPQCPHCGNPDWMRQQAEQPFALRQVEIGFSAEGGYRSCPPQQTLARYRSHISPLTGTVNYLHPMPYRHGGYRKVYVSGYQVCPQQLGQENGFDKICAGKGQTDEQAQASALCEALERVSSVWQGDEAIVMASFAQLQEAGDQPIELNTLQNFSPAQFAQRRVINAANADRRRQVPEPLSADQVIGWTPAWSLQEAQKVWVPAHYCFAEAPAELGAAHCIYNPNGTAAGNCVEEAIFQGLLELIERDATAIWWYNQIPRPQLDIGIFDEPYFALLQHDYRQQGWQVQVLDLSQDLQIPVYAAVAHHPQQQRFAIGFGCHLQAKLAVSRALTELNQLMDSRPNTPPPWNQGLLAQPDFLFATETSQHFCQVPSGHDLLSDLHLMLDRLANKGMQAYAVNKTRPDIGLSVVQVIVPGLRHFWPRFDQGRLYDVPVKMNWKAEATAERNLNPAPLFL